MYVAVLEIVLSLPQRVQLNVVGKQLCALFLFLLFAVIFQANKAIEYSGILQAAVAMRGGRIQIVRVKSSRSLLVLLRMRPRVHQAGLLHAISPISMKLGQFKGSTPKLQKTNWFLFWIFLGGDRRPPLVLLYFYQGKCYNIRQK